MQNKTRIPRQNRGLQTREKLVIAALELFSEKGYHSTNSKEIAARGKVATGSFYAYFNDKKELFIEAYKYYAALIEKDVIGLLNPSGHENEADQGQTTWTSLFASGTDRDKLKIIINNMMIAHNRYPGFIREITVMRLLDPDIKKIIDDHEKSDIVNIINLIKTKEDGLRIKDPDVAANIIFRILEVIVHEVQTIPGIRDSRERIINEMSDMVYRYLFE